MSAHRFDADVLELLRRELEVEIQTAAADGGVQRTTIWVVVDGEEVFVRSWRGEKSRWFRAALERPTEVIVIAGGRQIPVLPIPAIDGQSVSRCSAALKAKYAGSSSTPSMLRREILNTTLLLEPRPGQ